LKKYFKRTRKKKKNNANILFVNGKILKNKNQADKKTNKKRIYTDMPS